MQHLEDGLLHELVDGEIPSEQLGPIQQHLSECASCRGRLAAARDLTSVTDSLIAGLDAPVAADPPVVPLPIRRTAPRWNRGIGIAASLLVAAGVGYGARDLVPPPGVTDQATPGAAAVVEADVPADAVAATESPTLTPPPVLTVPAPAPAREQEAPTSTPAEAPAAAVGSAREQVSQSGTADADLRRQTEGTLPVAPQVAGAAAPAMRAAPEPQSALAESRRVTLTDRARRPMTLNALTSSESAEMAAKSTAAPVAIEFADAIALLGGRLRLVEGLVPSRLERAGEAIRVIYPVTGGLLTLSQERSGDTLTWTLTGPAGFSADSLHTLRGRIRD